MRRKRGNRGEKALIAPELYLVPNVRFGTERRVEMRSCPYDGVFPISSAKDFRGWHPGNDNRHNSEEKSGLSKISIAWWLVPAVVVWATSALVFG